MTTEPHFGFEPGTKLRAPLDPGRAVVDTEDAVLARIWSANGAPAEEEGTPGGDALQAWRSQEAAEWPGTTPAAALGEELTDAGRAMLEALDLD